MCPQSELTSSCEKLTVNEGLFNGDTKETGTVEFKNDFI